VPGRVRFWIFLGRHYIDGGSVCGREALGHWRTGGASRGGDDSLHGVGGWAFPERDLDNYLGSTLDGLISNPAAYVPELIGGLILACFALLLVRRNGVRAFVKRGRLDSRGQ
jgi:hypothetical protein